MSRRNFLRSVFYGGGGLITTYSVMIERYAVQVNAYDVAVPYLPESFEGFQLLQITDLHYGFLMPLPWIQHLIDKANALQPDAIVLTGDYVHKGRSKQELLEVWPQLTRLKARYGAYMVLGNHEHWANRKLALELLHESGFSVRHIARPIEKNGRRVWIAGAGDFWEDDDGIDLALQNVPENECRIVLAHNPDTADIYRKSRIDLMISGHTHGGQIVVPFIGPLVIPVHNKLYSHGYIQGDNIRLFISRGIGWTIFPIRFNCPPEMALLRLRRG